MADDYARTERGVPVFNNVDEAEAAAAAFQPSAGAAQSASGASAQRKEQRDMPGPAWAGTLAGVHTPKPMHVPAPIVTAPEVAVYASADEVAPTTVNQPAIRVAPVPRTQSPARGPGSAAAASDVYLRVGLALLVVAILLVAGGLFVVLALS